MHRLGHKQTVGRLQRLCKTEMGSQPVWTACELFCAHWHFWRWWYTEKALITAASALRRKQIFALVALRKNPKICTNHSLVSMFACAAKLADKSSGNPGTHTLFLRHCTSIVPCCAMCSLHAQSPATVKPPSHGDHNLAVTPLHAGLSGNAHLLHWSRAASQQIIGQSQTETPSRRQQC